MEFMSCPFCKNFVPDEEMLEVTIKAIGNGPEKEVVKDICPECAEKIAESICKAADEEDGDA